MLCIAILNFVYDSQVLKGVPERPDVALVRLREIKYKISKKIYAKDRHRNTLSAKDVVKILEGPCRVRSLALL